MAKKFTSGNLAVEIYEQAFLPLICNISLCIILVYYACFYLFTLTSLVRTEIRFNKRL